MNIGTAFLEPQAWEALNQVDSFDIYVQNWLALLCASIAGTERGVVVLRRHKHESYAPVVFWPSEQAKTDGLMKAAEATLNAGKGVCRLQEDASSQLAHPVRDDEGLRGVVALEVQGLNATEAPLAMRLLQWGLAGLLFALQRTDTHQTTQVKEGALRSVLDCVALVLENQGFEKACMVLVTHLASALHCRRVAIGFVKSHHYHLQALSHNITFSEKTQLSRALEATMAEAGDIARCLLFPPPKEGERRLYPAHEQLAGSHGGHTICTVPISDGQSILGALVLERAAEHGFDEETMYLCETAGTMAGLILSLKRDNEQGLMKRALVQTRTLLSKMLGPGYLFWKLKGLLLIGVIVFFAIAQGLFRISADAYLEGAIQQSVVAPMDGFVIKAPVRAGSHVKAKDLLFQLDDTDLRLEQVKWQNQRAQYQGKYRQALAQHKRAETRILKTQLAQAATQLELVQKQLARTVGQAPFDGIVISGDLSQSLGSPVERGQVLFEVAPLNDYRIILEVDEQDIVEIQEQQTGNIVLTSLADQILPFRIIKMTPVSETREGRNYFRVEANLTLAQAPTLLQPGMKGIGKIEVGQRHLIWIWTRSLINWLRVWLWSWWP